MKKIELLINNNKKLWIINTHTKFVLNLEAIKNNIYVLNEEQKKKTIKAKTIWKKEDHTKLAPKCSKQNTIATQIFVSTIDFHHSIKTECVLLNCNNRNTFASII